jgi:hypothetical protein
MCTHTQNGFADSLKRHARYFIDTDETRFLRGTFSNPAHCLKFLCTLRKKSNPNTLLEDVRVGDRHPAPHPDHAKHDWLAGDSCPELLETIQPWIALRRHQPVWVCSEHPAQQVDEERRQDRGP